MTFRSRERRAMMGKSAPKEEQHMVMNIAAMRSWRNSLLLLAALQLLSASADARGVSVAEETAKLEDVEDIALG